MDFSDLNREHVSDLLSGSADLADRIEQLLFQCALKRPLDPQLETNVAVIRGLIHHAADVQFTDFQCRGGLPGVIVYDPNFVDYPLVSQILASVTELAWDAAATGEAYLEVVAKTIVPIGAYQLIQTVEDALNQVWSGAVVLLLNGTAGALALNIGKIDKRSITRPISEQVVLGPHDGFIEDGMTNLSLVRQRLRTPRLWIERMVVGQRTRTAVYVLSLYGVTDDQLVRDVKQRLELIHIDGVLDANYLVEIMRSDRWTWFPTVLETDRPDRVAAGLLEGRVAIIVDGTPTAIVAPAPMSTLMTSASDYYQNWLITSVVRGVRYLALIASILMPGLYVALTTYHQEAIPTPLLITMAASRNNVPLPAAGEVLLLMVLFDIIREAGARVPSGIGSALTIGGTLVVGDAAVRAGIISSPIIIVVAGIVIAIYAIPVYELAQAVRFTTYPVIIGGAVLGMYGILFVVIALLMHLASLESFGVPYLSPVAPAHPQDFKDVLVRAPWFRQKTRPSSTGYPNPIRQGPGSRV